MRQTEHTVYPLLRPSVTFEQVEQAAYFHRRCEGALQGI